MSKKQKVKLLHHTLVEKDKPDMFTEQYELPSYLQANLKNKLRPYQEKALRHFHYTQNTEQARNEYRHLMFNMATGSGKTMILASTILYLFEEQGYQNFLFFVHSDAIVQKTKQNLLNEMSNKFLFKNPLEINGKKIEIKAVNEFPVTPEKNTIYLKLSTIHKIHDELTSSKENGLSIDDLKETPLVLLGDEAHHFNALTKDSKKKTKAEQEAESWEKTIHQILRCNPKHKLLEFTATLNLENKDILKKYKDIIVYSYDLKSFMVDGFSKKVMLLEADQEDNEKMLDAVLLSQYRKLIAQDNGIKGFKPLILFKSNQVATSQAKQEDFTNIILNLTPEMVRTNLLNKRNAISSNSSIWVKVINYYLSPERDLMKVVDSIKDDFDDRNLLNVNKTDLLEEHPIILNTLEDINNPFRAIFAVAKLNEGWDVLNLYDIVRISETATNTKTSTDSEAQLIGRGARYYPFEFEGQQSFVRRYDNSTDDLSILEQLHYHTINDQKYIKTLHKSLDQANIDYDGDGLYEFKFAKVKDNFKKTSLFNHGKVYFNEAVEIEDDKRTWKTYSLEKRFEIEYNGIDEKGLDKLSNDENQSLTKIETLKVDKRFYHKVMQRIDFYKLDNLQYYFPKLKSLNEFIVSSDYLGDFKIDVVLPLTLNLNNVSPKTKLRLLEIALINISQNAVKNYKKYKGTYNFKQRKIKDLVQDYEVAINPEKITTQKITSESTVGKKWYVFDNAILNQLEHRLVKLLNGFMDGLSKKYKDIYLIRNDEKSMRFKLTEFEGVRGFMPDFILMLTGIEDGARYQVFLEPKGDDRLLEDAWKEQMLIEINDNENIVFIDDFEGLNLVGIKFFADSKFDSFIEDFENKLYNGEKLEETTLVNLMKQN